MSEDQELAIVFADVVGSTHLYEAMGDDRARETVQRCLEVMKEATEQFGGNVIKTMGITNNPGIGDLGTNVAIRIGSHYGPVVTENRDISGLAVHTANKMTSQAKAGQILITAATVEQLSGEWQGLVRQIDVAAVRGRADELAVFEVLWQPEEATSMLPAVNVAAKLRPTAQRLRLCYQDSEVLVDQSTATDVTMGRADENDLVIKGNLISRVHARVAVVKNRYMLVDESTNGTFIQRDDGEEIYVRRDSTELSGSGIISLGRVAPRGAPLAIEYSLEA